MLPYSGTLSAEFVLPLKGYEKLSILLTYRSKNIGTQDFIEQMTYLTTLHKPDLVLGDFNINALKDSPLCDTMRQNGYTLLGSEPTHIMGGLLDHVYIKNNSNLFDKLTLQIHPVYYSDHDAILLNFSV